MDVFFITSNPRMNENGLMLKYYREGAPFRLIASHTMKGMEIETEIEYANQRQVLALSEIPSKDWSLYFGRVLLVRKVMAIPVDFILDSEEEDVVVCVRNRNVIPRHEALQKGRFIEDPQKTIDEIEGKVISVYKKAQKLFNEKGLFIKNVRFNFGIDLTGNGPPSLLWVGEGITPRTAIICNGKERMIDCLDFMKKLIPQDVIHKETIGED